MRFMFLRVKVFLIKEVLQALRDSRLRFLIILPPLFQLVAFGYAANLDLKNIPMALYDEDNSGISRELASAFPMRFGRRLTPAMAKLYAKGSLAVAMVE